MQSQSDSLEEELDIFYDAMEFLPPQDPIPSHSDLEEDCRVEELSPFWRETQLRGEQGISSSVRIHSRSGGEHGLQMILGGRYITLEDQREHPVRLLLDSGCTHTAIDSDFASQHNLQLLCLKHPVPVKNADGTLNQAGAITHLTEGHLNINGHHKTILYAVV